MNAKFNLYVYYRILKRERTTIMKEQTTEKKPFTTPKQYAISSLIIVMIVFLLATVMSTMFIEDKYASRIGMLAGGITAVIMYLIPNKTLDLKRKIKTFDVTVPLMILLLNWTSSEIVGSAYGMIASRFSSIKTDTTDFSSMIAVVGAVVIAPVCEELMFRLCGIGLMKKCFGKAFTFLLPTVLFALLHFYSVQGIIKVFTGAIFYAICYYFTENILYSIMAHMLHNALAIPVFFDNLRDINNGYAIMRPLPLAIYILLFAAGMFWLIRVFMKKYGDSDSKMANDNETVTC